MNDTALSAIIILAAYFIGSIPFGLLIAKWVAGIDVRTLGSGNIGATNVARVVGKKWGIGVLGLDCLKGLGPTLLLPMAAPFECPHLPVACGIAAIFGHVFPCWLKFRGGKGVATTLGVVIVLAPKSLAAAFAVFAITIWIFDYVALSSVLAAVTLAVCQIVLLWPAPFSEKNWSLGVFSVAIPLLIIVRHHSNIRRLLKGTEEKFRKVTGEDAAPTTKLDE